MSHLEKQGAADDKKKKRSKEVDTALHVLKGAIVTVLGADAAVTAGVEFSSNTKGSITVNFTEKPSDEAQSKIENVANDIIAADIPVREFVMERKAAEEKYQKEKVNHTYIYDAFPVPDSLTELNLVEIKDININCCPGPHLSSTGRLKALTLSKVNSKGAKKVQFSFVVGDAALAERKTQGMDGVVQKAEGTKSNASRATAQSGAAAQNEQRHHHHQQQHLAPPHKAPSCRHATVEDLLEQVSRTLDSHRVALDPAGKAALLQQLHVGFDNSLATLQNQAYTLGFKCQKGL